MTKQSDFYTQLKQETETKVVTYKDFSQQILSLNQSTAQKINTLKADMKFISKQIADNNKKLKAQGQPTVEFGK
jgi:capsule polysaccharide export protein KpsE/RkpR